MSTGGNLRLQLFLALTAIAKSKSDEPGAMTKDVARIAALVEAFLSIPALAAATNARVGDNRVKVVTAKNRAQRAAAGRPISIE